MLLAAGCSSMDYGVWTHTPEGLANKDISGVRFGLPLSVSDGKVNGAEIALFLAGSAKVSGFQYSLVGMSAAHELSGMQMGFLNVTDKPLDGLQLGIFNESGGGDWQIGIVNFSSGNTDVQIGIFNYNENARFPVTLFFNRGR